ncbi:MAG: alpha/beta hydrolase domain-containing protein [Acidobacteria bacterium]|nr:alpha/beta hydrolase domain-containing protein [Acidobacteriota bacterium]
MRFCRLLLTVVLGLGLSGFQGVGEAQESASPALARSRVTQLDITSREAAFGGRSFGAVGAYEILLGTATAVADPGDPLNAGIADLENAPRNSDGLVEYTFEVDILKPVDITLGNGVLVYEVNNRGRNIVFGYFHEAGRGYAAGNAGSAFLMDQGYTYVSSGWLHGASGAGDPRPVLAAFPLATDDGRTITGVSMEEWQDPDSAAFGRLTYPAATLDASAATLTHRQLQDDPRQTVPADGWRYVDDTTVAVTPPAGTDAGTIYEFVYEARDPIVHGLGFSAMRDLVSFARYRPADDRGVANPLFVDGVPVLDHAVAVGSSQSGRMIRDFLYQGFNEDAAGRRIFDGMTPYVAGARLTWVNARFAQTGRYTRQHEDHNYPMDEFPFTFATTTDPLTGRTDGLLAACTASDTCPRIIQVDAESEYYGAHASLILTDTSGRAMELPPNVRYWVLATAHLQGDAGCRDPRNPVLPWPYYRAAFDATVRWVRDGVEPPATRAPSVADGTAVTVERQGEQYPTIPDRPYNGAISTLGVRDFSVWPPKESDERYPLFVPSLDADGNLVAGVIVPEVAAPLSTMGKAVRAAGFAEGDLCGVNGSTIAFPRTREERMARGDSRLSLEERYPGGEEEYVRRYGEAADALVAQRYLLPADAETLKASAAAAWRAAIAAAVEDPQ